MNEGIGDICGLVEEALYRYVLSKEPSFCPDEQVYRGVENRETEANEGQNSSLRKLPSIVCVCYTAPPMPINFRGNFEPICSVQVISNRDDTTRADHRARVEEVFGWFLTETIAADLTAAIENFYVAGVVPQQITTELRMRSWVSELPMLLRQVCARRIE